MKNFLLPGAYPTFFQAYKVSIVAFLIVFIGTEYLQAQDFHLKGCVLDSVTNEPLPFVSIITNDHGLGGTSNALGEFEMKLPVAQEEIQLQFSYVGYKSRKVTASSSNVEGLVVLLQPDTVKLPEILISTLTGAEIINKVISNAEKNYNPHSFQVLGFQREIIKSGSEYNQLLEADFTTEYVNNEGKTYLTAGRYAENKKARAADLLWDDKKGGFYTFGLTHLGGITSPVDEYFLGLPLTGKNSFTEHYDFQLKNAINYNGRHLYVIEFEQKTDCKMSLVAGELFVDSEDFAIVKMEYTLSEIGKGYLKTNTAWNGEELTKSKAFKKINIEDEVVVMTFNKIGDYWYPGTYIRDIEFNVQVILLGKKSPMKRLRLHSECVITNVNTLKFAAISKMEIPSSLYYFQVHLKNHCQNYNPADWGHYTAIKSDTNFSTIVEDISRMNSLEEASGN
jgi:hypothetical protein